MRSCWPVWGAKPATRCLRTRSRAHCVGASSPISTSSPSSSSAPSWCVLTHCDEDDEDDEDDDDDEHHNDDNNDEGVSRLTLDEVHLW